MEKSARFSLLPELRMALRLSGLLWGLLLPGAAPRAFAQEDRPPHSEPSRQQVFAPFVSRLEAAVEGSRIRLSWRNPQDLQGSKLVYRSTVPLSDATFADAVLVARLDPQADGFVDTPPDTGDYYYAVLLEADDGTPYRLFIPFRNVTSREVQVAAQVPAEDLATRVSAITAAVMNDAVQIRFSSSRADRELLLFRSESRLEASADLLDAAAPVSLDPGADGYVDYPIPGIGYYYCVLDAELFKIGQAKPVAGENSTVSAVQIPIGVGRVGLPSPGSFRPLPLPLLLIESAVQSGEQLAPSAPFRLPPVQGSLREDTRAAVARALAAARPAATPVRELEILPEDRPGSVASGSSETAPSGTMGERGASLALTDIVNAETARTNPAGAALSLQNFLRIRRTDAVEDRAHFYLGQMYYMVGRYREGLMEFLLARDTYYPQSERWLTACFRRLWREES